MAKKGGEGGGANIVQRNCNSLTLFTAARNAKCKWGGVGVEGNRRGWYCSKMAACVFLGVLGDWQ